jgi:hypothetical protein
MHRGNYDRPECIASNDENRKKPNKKANGKNRSGRDNPYTFRTDRFDPCKGL